MENPELKLKSLISKKELLFARVQRLYNESKKISVREVRNSFLLHYQSLEDTRQSFEKTVQDISLLNLQIDENYEPNFQELDAFDELYCAVTQLAKSMAAEKASQDSNPHTPKALPKLPKIELKEFSGDWKEWPIFYETYKSLIHQNSEIDNTTKLHYLLGKLSGKALSVCSGIQPSGQNYSIIWKALVDKYQDERLLANSYMTQILEFKQIQTPTAASLNAFLEKFDTAVSALKRAKLGDLADFIFSFLALSKLDNQTHRLFEQLHGSGSDSKEKKTAIPKYDDVIKFVKDQAKIVACTSSKGTPATSLIFTKPQKTHSLVVSRSPNSNRDNLCLICRLANHLPYQCNQFIKLAPTDRYKLVKEKGFCLNCLSSKHKINSCRSSNFCSSCHMKHHSLLHFQKPHPSDEQATDNTITTENDNSANPQTTNQPLSLCAASKEMSFSNNSTTLLATAVVNVETSISKTEKGQSIRMLIDPGSQSHFLTAKCCKKLNLTVRDYKSTVKGIGSSSCDIIGKVDLVIASRVHPACRYKIAALVVDHITDSMPVCHLPKNSFDYLLNLPLADNEFYKSGEIDGLLSAELFPHLLGSTKVTGPPGFPVALETTLGFIVMGDGPIKVPTNRTTSLCCAIRSPSTEDLLEKFWLVEEVPAPTVLNSDDVKCEENFVSTVKREASGRYTVSLPFKEFPPALGDSWSTAYKRFLSLERKFRQTPLFFENYSAVIRDYISQGHLSLVDGNQLNVASSFYIPHHAVFKESSSTPLRVVFDASAKSDNSLSLNDVLYTGEKLQTDLMTILINFRLFSIAMTSDVRQMYRQIWLNPAHRCYQRILWRFSPDEPIDTYQINVVSFGVKSSPYLALRTVKQLASDESENFPLGAQVACRDTYMDDVVTSIPTVKEGILLFYELDNLFKSGGFELTKWATNAVKLFDQIPETHRSEDLVEFSDTALKLLGFQWHPLTDTFTFKITIPEGECTKRHILSTVSRIWDPLGLIAPVTLYAKLLIQELWLQKLSWDEVAPPEIQKLWKVFLTELHLLSNFSIPRHVGILPNSPAWCIGFSDASQRGYGAVVYIRVFNFDVQIKLACAKSKVAPLKVLTIPRLELVAALLLAKLINFVIDAFKSRFSFTDIIALTDSTVVLDWLNSPSYRWNTFVANRTAKIHDLVPVAKWFHIEGEENPADCISRGLTPSKLINHSLWLSGPSWLKTDIKTWPICVYNNNMVASLEEKPICHAHIVGNENYSDNRFLALIHRSSSWLKLLNSCVCVLKFLKVLSRKTLIGIDDLEKAELVLIRLIQEKHFAKELDLLSKGQLCSPSFRHLSPILEDGIIRVGGRLRNASNLEFNQKHPILLPKKDHLVDLLIDFYHRTNLHTGPHLLLSLLRQKYWILSARRLVRLRIRNCNYCFRFRPKNNFPEMGNLPTIRVTEAKAFLHCGVDYAGPYHITLSRHRGVKSQKAYLCLFICLTTKAIHLELASDLSTGKFLDAFKRFLARRGPCSVLYSDCGTNFIGAKASLDELFSFLESNAYNSALGNELVKHRIQWKFNPPASPHFGGIWESNIKSVKSHLSKVIGSQILSYEEFNTVLHQIEALLNSRPLCCLSSDPSEPLALTPAHFLTGTPLQFLPAYDLTDKPENLVSRKELLDKLVQTYWKRWHIEYLHTLQSRQKWNNPSNPVQVGTVVILRSENLPPLQWPLGVIIELFPGNDGIVRVAKVKTKTGTYKRPIVKLCPLPTQ